jgi:hypothetical protein
VLHACFYSSIILLCSVCFLVIARKIPYALTDKRMPRANETQDELNDSKLGSYMLLLRSTGHSPKCMSIDLCHNTFEETAKLCLPHRAGNELPLKGVNEIYPAVHLALEPRLE